jgi:hypothetical protein
MRRALAATLFGFFRISRCPTCGQWSRFARPVPALTGHIPAELQGLVPYITKCYRNGCTSSVRAITDLELRTVSKEA